MCTETHDTIPFSHRYIVIDICFRTECIVILFKIMIELLFLVSPQRVA